MIRSRNLLVVTLLGLPAVPSVLCGQAVITASVQGTVAGQDGAPVRDATVEVTNAATGQRWQVDTRADGHYAFENVTIGGPYDVAARAIGFAPAGKTGITLTLGQRYTADFALEPATAVLPEVIVRAEVSSQANPGRTGPAQLVPDSALRQLPNQSREVTDLAILSPQVSRSPYGSLQVGGQNPNFTGFQVDGAQGSDLASGGIATFLPRLISPEAIQELQVLVAPADVRNGTFAGGALNVVTRSGTNAWRGSGFGFLQNQDLVGTNAAGEKQGDFASWQYGATLSGPIVRNRLHFFLNAELQHAVTPDNGPFVTDTAGGADISTIGIRHASVVRFDSILTNVYGLDPGSIGRSDGRFPGRDLFAKLSAQLGTNHVLELSHHYAHTSPRFAAFRGYGFYQVGSVEGGHRYTLNVSRAIWRGLIGRNWSNEMILGYLRGQFSTRDANLPCIEVRADDGSIDACPANLAAREFRGVEEIFELTDNLTLRLGRHLLTFGTHNELLHFTDNNFSGSGGFWFFSSLDSLALGLPDFYERTVPGPLQPGGPNVDFRVRQLGLYAQDRWTVTPRLTLTLGLRLDVPFLPDAGTLNPAVRDSLGLTTGRLPSGNVLWSPRLGVNYDLGGRARTFLRGSVGLYSGHPAYRWIANGYRDSGGEQGQLTCSGAAVPPFDPLNPPITCAGGTGAEVDPRITVFDPGLKYPQNWKLSLGLDQRLPWGLVGTVDLLYTRWVSQFYFTDVNLGAPLRTAAGEGGRLLYGTIAEDGSETPSRLNNAFGQIVRVSSRGRDRGFLASFQLQRSFAERLGFSASYTYSRVRDAFSLINYFAGLNLGHTPLDGSLEDRRLATSFFEVPHQVVLAASVALPLRSRFSLTYVGRSQSPYSYVVEPGDANNGDVNADGVNAIRLGNFVGQDVVYVPRDARPGGDVSLVVRDDATGDLVSAPAETYAALDRYITEETCLDRQRGRLMERNSCRNPWLGTLNARLTKMIPTVRGQSIEVSADLLNALALVKRSWGEYRRTTDQTDLPLLRLQGYDQANQRGIYELNLPVRDQVDDFASRWRLLVGLRYSF